jgi:hypothetical protein
VTKRLRDNWYRDVWLLVITLFVVVLALKILSVVNEIQEGRRDSAGISCAVSSATVTAGKLVIVQSSEQPLPPKLEQFLEEHGLPPLKDRQLAARGTADEYTKLINAAIVKYAGVRGTSVLEPDKLPNGQPNPAAGLLNCDKLRALAKVGRR